MHSSHTHGHKMDTSMDTITCKLQSLEERLQAENESKLPIMPLRPNTLGRPQLTGRKYK